MAVERRLRIALADLSHVVVKCVRCGIEIRLATAGGAIPSVCPCGQEFDKATHDTLVALDHAYETAQSSATEFAFDLTGLEFRRSASRDTDDDT